MAARAAERSSVGDIAEAEAGPGGSLQGEPVGAAGWRGAPDLAFEAGNGAGRWGGSTGGAAPAADREDGGERLLGDIVLDGHVVGQWISDRMARDAARPGAGTTGFDPRQGPAWTPAGAL